MKNIKEKIFIESYIKIDEKNLTEKDKEAIRDGGVELLLDGGFWFKVAKEYARRINITQ